MISVNSFESFSYYEPGMKGFFFMDFRDAVKSCGLRSDWSYLLVELLGNVTSFHHVGQLFAELGLLLDVKIRINIDGFKLWTIQNFVQISKVAGPLLDAKTSTLVVLVVQP